MMDDECNNHDKVVCLECGWKGFYHNLDHKCTFDSDIEFYSTYDNDGCPVCKSLGWEYED